MSFADTHIDIEDLTKGMSPTEEAAFDLGYIAAVHSFVEEIQRTKVRISTTLLDELATLTLKRKLELQSRLHILDILSQHYSQRLENLTKEFG